METKLSWIDKFITPNTNSYKSFVKEMENTSPEVFHRDGERTFSPTEKKFIDIYKFKENKKVQGSEFVVNTVYNSDEEIPVNNAFNNKAELSLFLNKQKLDNKVLIIHSNVDFSEVTVDSEAKKQKLLSDLWARELESKTELSIGLTNSQIDERQAYHYRNYIIEAKKISIEINPFLEIDKNKFDIQNTAFDIIKILNDGEKTLMLDAITTGIAGSSTEIDSVDSLIKNLDRQFIPEGFNKSISIRVFGEHSKQPIFHTINEGEKNNLVSILKRISNEEKTILNINNYTQNIMETQKDFNQEEYMKAQLRYLGFGEGEKLHKDLKNGIDSPDKTFEINTTSDKTLPGNSIEFNIKFAKSENGGVFLNSYDAILTKNNENISQNFRVSRDNSFTAKEAINLLEGRSVKIEFTNPKTTQIEQAFVKLNLGEEKNQYGNYNFQTFHQNYGVDVNNIVENSKLIFDKPEFKDNVIKSLEKGNIVKVKLELDGNVMEGKAVLNPQYKTLNLYDNDMNRINTNKALEGVDIDDKHEKSNVREHSKSRGI